MATLVEQLVKCIEDGGSSVSVLPAVDDASLNFLAEKVGPLPEEYVELLRETVGLDLGAEGSLDFMDFGDAGVFAGLFPKSLRLWTDESGNKIIWDALDLSERWGNIYLICHDPACVAILARDIESFLTMFGSERFWRVSPADPLSSFSSCLREIWKHDALSNDIDAAKIRLPPTFLPWLDELSDDANVYDLREAKVGQGFRWARQAGTEMYSRCGDASVFSVATEQKGRLIRCTNLNAKRGIEEDKTSSTEVLRHVSFPCVLAFKDHRNPEKFSGFLVAKSKLHLILSIPITKDSGIIIDCNGNYYEIEIRPKKSQSNRNFIDKIIDCFSNSNFSIDYLRSINFHEQKSIISRITLGFDIIDKCDSELFDAAQSRLKESNGSIELIEFADWFQKTDGGIIN